MKEFNTKQFAELLENEGFINAVKRFKAFAERKQSRTLKALPKLQNALKTHEIDHYKAFKGFCVMFGKNSGESKVNISFVFSDRFQKPTKVRCYKDVSELANIQTSEELWKLLRELFAKEVTNTLIGNFKAKKPANKAFKT